jgi:hypothetical protein
LPLVASLRAKRTKETAREVDADMTRKEFNRAFKRIVPPKKPRAE